MPAREAAAANAAAEGRGCRPASGTERSDRSWSTSRNEAPGMCPARYSSRPRPGAPSSQRQSTNCVRTARERSGGLRSVARGEYKTQRNASSPVGRWWISARRVRHRTDGGRSVRLLLRLHPYGRDRGRGADRRHRRRRAPCRRRAAAGRGPPGAAPPRTGAPRLRDAPVHGQPDTSRSSRGRRKDGRHRRARVAKRQASRTASSATSAAGRSGRRSLCRAPSPAVSSPRSSPMSRA